MLATVDATLTEITQRTRTQVEQVQSFQALAVQQGSILKRQLEQQFEQITKSIRDLEQEYAKWSSATTRLLQDKRMLAGSLMQDLQLTASGRQNLQQTNAGLQASSARLEREISSIAAETKKERAMVLETAQVLQTAESLEAKRIRLNREYDALHEQVLAERANNARLEAEIAAWTRRQQGPLRGDTGFAPRSIIAATASPSAPAESKRSTATRSASVVEDSYAIQRADGKRSSSSRVLSASSASPATPTPSS
jgi:chromosome segregation ATPase